MKTEQIKQFWHWFATFQSEMAVIKTRTTAKSQFWRAKCTEQIATIHPRLGAEMWWIADKQEHWLIITARGDEDLFETVDAVVGRAPDLPGWKVQALFPAAKPDFRLAQKYDLRKFNPLDLKFNVENVLRAVDSVDLLLYARDNRPVFVEHQNAVWDLLFNLVGERVAGTWFTDIIISPVHEVPKEVAQELFVIEDLCLCLTD